METYYEEVGALLPRVGRRVREGLGDHPVALWGPCSLNLNVNHDA